MRDIICHAAFEAASEVYSDNIDLGTTEYLVKTIQMGGKPCQILAFCGTNETSDWKENIDLRSWGGIKYSAWKAVHKVREHVKITPDIVTGHSKGAAAAVAWAQLFPYQSCVLFSPARALRPWIDREMRNTILFSDPDDVVPRLAFLSFRHPKCTRVELKEDKFGYRISDHSLSSMREFIYNLPEEIDSTF